MYADDWRGADHRAAQEGRRHWIGPGSEQRHIWPAALLVRRLGEGVGRGTAGEGEKGRRNIKTGRVVAYCKNSLSVGIL